MRGCLNNKVKSKIAITIVVSVLVIAVSTWFSLGRIKAILKEKGYIEYTPDEAVSLAYAKCGRCHNIDKVTKYCFRCGPPFIVVVHNMKKLISLEREKPGMEGLPTISDAESIAITQVWNSLIGNWEEGWRKDDIRRLIKGDEALIKLLDTPPSDRKLERALAGKSIPGVHKEGTFVPQGSK